jgi:hypothetical protein
VQLWTWNAVTEEWHATNAGVIGGTTVVSGSLTKGSQFRVDVNPAHRQGFIQVTGLAGGAAAQTAVITVTKVR